MKKPTPEEVKSAWAVFHSLPIAQVILWDLDRHSRRAKVDSDNVNPNNAVYRCGQEDQIQYIKNKKIGD